MPDKLLHVNAGGGYDIPIGKGLLDRAGTLLRTVAHGKKIAVITDETVRGLYGGRLIQSLTGAGFETSLFAFPAGERSKTHETLLHIYAFLAQADITRSDLIVALGGGVPGDVAGFAAATWQRGIDFVQIPTTLLAQMDSSIGGKTAVDLPEGKNLVGAFWQPRMVLCDTETLHTLPDDVFACGMGEVIKHACIKSEPLYESLLARSEPFEEIEAMVAANLSIKRDVVERDERERGERMLLNFGHTLGHAIEKLNGYQGISHGEAVAMGMSLITHQSEKNGLTQPGTAQRLTALLAKYHLPCECPLPPSDIVEAARGDKKRAGGDITLVLLRRIGEAYLHRIPVSQLSAFFGL